MTTKNLSPTKKAKSNKDHQRPIDKFLLINLFFLGSGVRRERWAIGTPLFRDETALFLVASLAAQALIAWPLNMVLRVPSGRGCKDAINNPDLTWSMFFFWFFFRCHFFFVTLSASNRPTENTKKKNTLFIVREIVLYAINEISWGSCSPLCVKQLSQVFLQSTLGTQT